MQKDKENRKVLIGTPSYDGRLDAWYVNSLIQTIKLSYEKNIDITTLWVSYDALIQRARNDTFSYAVNMEFDDLIFIDSDIEWDPNDFFKLLDHNVDVVGGVYPKKNEALEYPIFHPSLDFTPENNGLVKVSGIGTGFLRFSKKAMKYLYDNSKVYYEIGKPEEKRMVFDVGISQDNIFVSEDIIACLRLQEGNFDVYIDPSIECNHNGVKKFIGNFQAWTTAVKGQAKEMQQKSINNPFVDDTII